MFAKVVLVLTVSLLAYVVGKLMFRRSGHAMTSKAAVGATTRRLSWRGDAGGVAVCGGDGAGGVAACERGAL